MLIPSSAGRPVRRELGREPDKEAIRRLTYAAAQNGEAARGSRKPLAKIGVRVMFNVDGFLFNRCEMVRRVRPSSGPVPPGETMGFAEAPQSPIIDDLVTTIERDRVRIILDIAKEEGMLEAKTARISGRVSPVLIERAKLRTGLGSDTDLIEFALASLAVDDDFAVVFRRLEGTVDPDVPLGY